MDPLKRWSRDLVQCTYTGETFTLISAFQLWKFYTLTQLMCVVVLIFKKTVLENRTHGNRRPKRVFSGVGLTVSRGGRRGALVRVHTEGVM